MRSARKGYKPLTLFIFIYLFIFKSWYPRGLVWDVTVESYKSGQLSVQIVG